MRRWDVIQRVCEHMLMSVKDSGCFPVPACESAFCRQLDIYEFYIYPTVVQFCCLSTNFDCFSFCGSSLCARKPCSEENVSRHVSTFLRDIKHMDDTLPSLVRGRSTR